VSEKCPKFFYGNCPIIKQENEDLIKEFLDDLNKINKIVAGGCPKINVVTEIFGMKKKWEGKLNTKT